MRKSTNPSQQTSKSMRSRSAPNANANKNFSQTTNFRYSIAHHPCAEIQEPCDFYTNEIKVRPFISPLIKRTLLEQLKQTRILGMRINSTKTKKTKSNTNQFWEKWEGFKITLNNEVNSQFSTTKNSLEKKSSLFADLSKLIKVDNLNKDVISLTKTLNDDLSQDTEQNFSSISANLKQLQNHVSSLDDRNNDSNVKLQFTSLASQILTLMKTIKDIKLSTNVLYKQIEIDNETFQQLIPYDGPIFIPHQNITEEPEIKKPKRGQSLPKKVKKEKPIAPIEKEAEIEEIDNEFDSQLDAAKNENARLKEQLQLMRETKFSKTIEVNTKKKNEEEEINLLRSKISRLNKKVRRNSITERESQTYSGLNNPLLQLRTEVRNLEIEKVELNAADDFYINEIQSNQIDSNEYEKHAQLQNKKDLLNKELFELRLKCIDLNKTIQKANSGKFGVNGESRKIQKAFAETNNTNKQLKKKLEDINTQYIDTQNQHNSIVSNKIQDELNETLNANDSRQQNQYQHQLFECKKNYLDKKCDIIEHNTNVNNDYSRSIRRSTDDNLSMLRMNARNSNNALNDELQSIKENYNYVTQRFNEASDKQEDEVEFNGQVYSLAEAEVQVGEILGQFNDLQLKSQQISVNEAEDEIKVLSKEINGISERNNSLLQSISDIKTKSIQVHSRLQSLKLQYQIYQKKNEDPKYSLRKAYLDAIQETKKENELLNAVLSNSLETLDNLHVERPF